MRENRRVPTQCAENLGLPECVGQVIVAANDMRDAHVMIVDNHGQHIRWRPVRPYHDQIVKLRTLEFYFSLDCILQDNGTVSRGLEPDSRVNTGGASDGDRSRQVPS